MTEDVTHAYYQGDKPLHPWAGETEPEFTGWNGEQKVLLGEGAALQREPMQVGPLAQVLVGYAQGHPLTTKYAELALEKISAIGGRARHSRHAALDAGPARRARHPRRHACRNWPHKHWQLLVNNIAKGDYTVHNQPMFPIA